MLMRKKVCRVHQRVQDVLNHVSGNYIMPFFWLHGAEEAVLRNCMDKIYECGIRAVCLEARPHKDFIGEKWWHDLDIILEEAKKKGMKVWILDDSHFPTGYANGAVKDAPEHLKRWSLMERRIEVTGPRKHCKFDVKISFGCDCIDKGQNQKKEPFSEELVAVVCGKRTEQDGKVIFTELEDVTAEVSENGWLYRDFEEGEYTVFVYSKRLGAAAGHNDYISLLEKESVRLLLDAVYEPHYAHYKEEFGKTIAGFFSDEPGFYNMPDNVYGLGKIGEKMPLPWTDDVAAKFRERTQEEHFVGDMRCLPGLFHELGGKERLARYAYMDIITRKYQENFTDQIAHWCEERGVEYIGHVLEDGLYTQNLGAGAGHYFRALSAQHMGGIDIVMNDLQPDKDYGDRAFYHYQLPVLAASIAEQNEKMQGRAMCEVFGAYGWSEGLDLMKWIADHMLVHGINYFVPHAFTDSAFPDPDCPPHFYGQGNNPQYRHMYVLFEYMNRVSHLLNGGHSVTDVAVLFPAEGSWSGACRDFGHVGKICLQNQVPYSVICMDKLKEAKIEDGEIVAGQARYKCLIVDKMDYLPGEYLKELKTFAEKGACIRFVDKIPACTEHGEQIHGLTVLEEKNLKEFLEPYRICRPTEDTKWLRVRRYELEGSTVLMFVNSSMLHPIQTTVSLPGLSDRNKQVVQYDAMEQKLYKSVITEDHRLAITLDKGESVLYFICEKEEDLSAWEKPQSRSLVCAENYDGEYQIFTASYDAQDQFEFLRVTKELEPIDQWKERFAGVIRYEMKVSGKKTKISLGECCGSAEVFVNGNPCGVRISYPFVFDIGEAMTDGENMIRVEVATTVFEALYDPLSLERAVPCAGLYGPVMFG